MDTSTYVDGTELTKYVWNNYQHLFSRLEQLGAKAVMAEDKANSASSLAMADLLRKKWGAENDPEIVAALSEGTEAFQRRVRERVIRECGESLIHKSLSGLRPNSAYATGKAMSLVQPFLARKYPVIWVRGRPAMPEIFGAAGTGQRSSRIVGSRPRLCKNAEQFGARKIRPLRTAATRFSRCREWSPYP